MYDNNQTTENNNINNSRPQEYYYTAGNGNNSSYGSGYNSGNYNNFQYNQPNNNNNKKNKSKKAKPILKKAASFVALGALFGVTAGVAFSVPTYMANQQLLATKAAYEKEVAQASAASLSTTTSSLAANTTSQNNTSSDVSAIAASCLPSVVSITNKGVTEVRTMFGTYQQDTQSSGSGIIIGKNDTELLIVTNYHVVSDSNELSVIFSYDENSDNPSLVSAKLKGYDSDKDLAVIAVSLDNITSDMMSQIKIATVGDSSTLTLGQEVVAIGNALGYGQSVTSGIISALNREVSVEADDGSTVSNKLIQTDAAINPGNSGGALLNMNGELIGINSVKVASSSVEGMGYAIPISDVESIIQELMLKETRDIVDESEQGYLGIGGTDVTSQISETYGMPVGVFINTVYDNSPAQAAGLAKGMIITKFDGQTVKTMSELKGLLAYYKQGETIPIVAMVQGSDGYTEQSFTLTLTSKSIFDDDTSSQENTQNNESDSNENNTNQNPYSFFWPFQTP